jgi:hypothetical protein
MTRPLVILAFAVGLSLGATGVVMARWHGEHAAGVNAGDVVTESGIGHPIYELDPRDDQAMAAYATDIFIGQVLGQTGDAGAPTSAPGHEMPQSQFAVEVLHTVKGEAVGVVTINQVGGLDAQSGRMMLLEGDTLLRSGRRELFLVVHIPEMEWYQIAAAGHGHLPADDVAEREALIARFTLAAAPSETDGVSSHAGPHGESS